MNLSTLLLMSIEFVTNVLIMAAKYYPTVEITLFRLDSRLSLHLIQHHIALAVEHKKQKVELMQSLYAHSVALIGVLWIGVHLKIKILLIFRNIEMNMRIRATFLSQIPLADVVKQK